MPVTAAIDSGVLFGATIGGIHTFLGIPYATAERFRPPVKVAPWAGMRSALVFGEQCPDGSRAVKPAAFMTAAGRDCVKNEACHFINVWTGTMERGAKRPVVFWFHGGAWVSGGSNESAVCEGASLCAAQDVVFVSMNHRLNVLGYTDLSAYGEAYRFSGNVGVADMVLALEWVRDNIAVFGGDPDNVTIMGQSGGGAKVALLMGLPAAQGLFHKAVIVSGYVEGVLQQTAREAAAALVEKTKTAYGLTSDTEAVRLLETMPYDDLFTLSAGIGVGRGPVVDGDYYPAKPYDFEAGTMVESAKQYPLIVTTTFGEMSGNMSPMCVTPVINNFSKRFSSAEAYMQENFKCFMSEGRKREKLEEKFGAHTEAALAAFRAAYPTHEEIDLLYLDNSLLTSDSRGMARIHARQAAAPVYRAVFAYEYPLFGGAVNWHTGGDLPLLLCGVDKIPTIVAGDEEMASALERLVSTALAAFARTGSPAHPELTWTAFMPDTSDTLVIDRVCQMRTNYDLALYDGYLPIDPMPS